MILFATKQPIPLTFKMVEKQENPEKIGSTGNDLSLGGCPAKPLFGVCSKIRRCYP